MVKPILNKYTKPKKRVLVGLSGGVDSAVAALLLKQKGYKVIGIFMKNWSDPVSATSERCPWRADLFDAKKVALKLDIPLKVLSFEKEYKEKVFKYFLKEYREGRTPNPDVKCNKEIKFKVLLEKAGQFKADFVATGHYAQIKKMGNILYLQKSKDRKKDQSYFLYELGQTELKKLIFPVGKYTKTHVRKIAKKFGLPNFNKKDSQGICFIGPSNFREFLKQYFKDKIGKIIDQKGNILGHHQGIFYYTIGQRENLGLGGHRGPYYVLKIIKKSNTLVVTNREKDLFKNELAIKRIHWISGQGKKLPRNMKAKIRYRSPDERCTIKKIGNKLRVIFSKPQRAITPGQSVVFYKGENVLGGGIID